MESLIKAKVTCTKCRKINLISASDIQKRIYNDASGLYTKNSIVCKRCGTRVYIAYYTVKKLEGH